MCQKEGVGRADCGGKINIQKSKLYFLLEGSEDKEMEQHKKYISCSLFMKLIKVQNFLM